MALIFSQVQDTPQTHVLIIGVGHYHYLSGGVTATEQVYDFAKNLTQLSSPVHSAKLFYEQVKEHHFTSSWLKPLGSVEILLDDYVDDFAGVNTAVEPATHSATAHAYRRWKTRCNWNSENVAIFYFAGHGYSKPEEQYLALSDFGQDPYNPWAGSMPFTSTRRAFHGCLAKTQIFFVDACRSIPPDNLLNTFMVAGMDTISNLQADCEHDLTILGAANNESAFGPKSGPAYFTRAILNGFRGYGANRDRRECIVSTGDFPSNVTRWLSLEKSSEGYKQRATAILNNPVDILQHQAGPEAEFLIDCDPGAALPLAAFSCKGKDVNLSREPNIDPWVIKVKAGLYYVSAEFTGAGFSNTSEIRVVDPPATKQTFKC